MFHKLVIFSQIVHPNELRHCCFVRQLAQKCTHRLNELIVGLVEICWLEMSATCWCMLPRCWQCWLKISQCQMSLMPWLDSWMGHVLAGILLHNCLAISMTHGAITPMEIMVIFKKTMVCMHEIRHTKLFSKLSCTKLHRYDVIFCKALLFFLYVQKSSRHVGKILADVLLTCCLAGWGNIFWWNVGQIFLTHFTNMTADVGTTCHLGGLGNITQYRHFHLRKFEMEYQQNLSCCKCNCFLGQPTPSLSLIVEISWYHHSLGFTAHVLSDFLDWHLCLAFPEAHDAYGSINPSFRIHTRVFAILQVFSTSVCPNLACAYASVSTIGSLVTLAFETSKCLLSTIVCTALLGVCTTRSNKMLLVWHGLTNLILLLFWTAGSVRHKCIILPYFLECQSWNVQLHIFFVNTSPK